MVFTVFTIPAYNFKSHFSVLIIQRKEIDFIVVQKLIHIRIWYCTSVNDCVGKSIQTADKPAPKLGKNSLMNYLIIAFVGLFFQSKLIFLLFYFLFVFVDFCHKKYTLWHNLEFVCIETIFSFPSIRNGSFESKYIFWINC